MNKKINNIVLLIVSLALGFVIITQYNTAEITFEDMWPNQKIQEISIELNDINEEKEQLLSELNELEIKLNEYATKSQEKNVLIDELTKDLEKYIIMAGYSDVKGPGIILTIDNPIQEVQYGNYTEYIYGYLLHIINNLNAAGAEAISINGQRYTTYTEIVTVGNHININGVSFVPPFEIKAIGDKYTLEKVLEFKGGVVWEMKELNYQINVEVSDEVTISKHMKPKDFEYAQPLKTTE